LCTFCKHQFQFLRKEDAGKVQVEYIEEKPLESSRERVKSTVKLFLIKIILTRHKVKRKDDLLNWRV